MRKLFLIIFALGLLVRLPIIGWLVILFGLFEIILRIFIFWAGLYITKRLNLNLAQNRLLFFLWLGCYLGASFASTDFSDINSYCCALLIIDPPDYMISLWMSLSAITVLLGLVLVIMARLRPGGLVLQDQTSGTGSPKS